MPYRTVAYLGVFEADGDQAALVPAIYAVTHNSDNTSGPGIHKVTARQHLVVTDEKAIKWGPGVSTVAAVSILADYYQSRVILNINDPTTAHEALNDAEAQAVRFYTRLAKWMGATDPHRTWLMSVEVLETIMLRDQPLPVGVKS